MIGFKRILVPVDWELASEHAIKVALALATEYGSALTLLHTWEGVGPAEAAARRMLDSAVARVAEAWPAVSGELRRGVPWREILATIEERAIDLVIVGTNGHHPVGSLLLGSIAEKVVRLSPVTTVVVRELEDGERARAPSQRSLS